MLKQSSEPDADPVVCHMPDLFSSESDDAIPGDRFARVAVERSVESPSIGVGLTYRVPDDIDASVGQRVEVPLGRGDRTTGGVVVEIGGPELIGELRPGSVKPIQRASGSALPQTLIELGVWIAEYYVCPLGMVLASMVPSAVKRRVGLRRHVRFERVIPDDPPPMPPAVQEAWSKIAALPEDAFPIEPDTLLHRSGARNRGPINRLLELGMLVEQETTRVAAPPPPGGSIERSDAPPLALNADQAAAIDAVRASHGRFAAHLMLGVTGSGKTEVYLRAIEHAIAEDAGGAIVLVPEISLTPQTSRRFLERFAHLGVAVLHSGLTASQRHAQWEAVARGESRIVIGARSAIFAPMPRVSIIVVDEEHDDSGYKQDQLPRYHARDVAVKRAHLERCPVLLGSATPSMESWSNSIGTYPKYSLLRLPDRVAGGQLPGVTVVDLRDERRARARLDPSDRDRLIGPTLERALDETLGVGAQALLLLNRRGHASHVCCPDRGCAWVLECDHCDAAMVQHRGATRRHRFVRCHRCLAEQRLPDTCPVCERRVILLGAGTQRLEDDLLGMFGQRHGLVEGETMVRVDGDTMRSARDYFDVMGRFTDGSIRVLLGTQMIAKGIDAPGVLLVGVINADTALSLPDFRAGERTFQLISQVAGRAGRRSEQGRVVVQTLNPTVAPVRLAAQHDFESFASLELAIRASAGMPPSRRMARVVCRDEDRAKANDRAADIATRLRDLLAGSGAEVEGPMDCPIARVAGFHRVAVEVRAADRPTIQQALGVLRDQGRLKSDARTAVDVDPTALM